MTIEQAIKALTDSPAVREIRRWQGGAHVRHYVTLMHIDRTYRGDRTVNIYIDEHAAELIMELGKGYMSTAAGKDFSAVLDLARTLGEVTRKCPYSGAPETVKLEG